MMTPALYQRSLAHSDGQFRRGQPRRRRASRTPSSPRRRAGRCSAAGSPATGLWRDPRRVRRGDVFPVKVPPDKTPYGKPTTPKWWHASATSPSKDLSFKLMSFWMPARPDADGSVDGDAEHGVTLNCSSTRKQTARPRHAELYPPRCRTWSRHTHFRLTGVLY